MSRTRVLTEYIIIRVTAELRGRLERQAANLGLTNSEALRQAIELWLHSHEVEVNS